MINKDIFAYKDYQRQWNVYQIKQVWSDFYCFRLFSFSQKAFFFFYKK